MKKGSMHILVANWDRKTRTKIWHSHPHSSSLFEFLRERQNPERELWIGRRKKTDTLLGQQVAHFAKTLFSIEGIVMTYMLALPDLWGLDKINLPKLRGVRKSFNLRGFYRCPKSVLKNMFWTMNRVHLHITQVIFITKCIEKIAYGKHYGIWRRETAALQLDIFTLPNQKSQIGVKRVKFVSDGRCYVTPKKRCREISSAIIANKGFVDQYFLQR